MVEGVEGGEVHLEAGAEARKGPGPGLGPTPGLGPRPGRWYNQYYGGVGFKYLILVLVLPIKQHLFEPFSPLDFCGEVGGPGLEGHGGGHGGHGGRPGLEGHAADLVCALHHHQQLKSLAGHVGSAQVVERRVFVNHVDYIKRPDKEYARLGGGVGGHLDVVHLLQEGTVDQISAR